MTGIEKMAVGAGVKSTEGILKIFFESKIDNLKQHLREQYIEKQISSNNIERIFSSYITNIYKQCNDLETIMFPQRTIQIESIYEPLALEPLDRNHENIKLINSSYERDIIHDNLVSNLTILDTAGMGKSTFCKNIVVKVIKNTQHTKIPIFVELRKAQEQTLIQYIVNDINLGYKNILSEDMFIKLMEKGTFLFIFDGFDELTSEKSTVIGEQIQEMSSVFESNTFILTSRKQAYIPKLDNQIVMNFLPLNINQIESLVLKYDKVISGEIGKRLISHPNYQTLDHSLFETPLMVNLLYRSFGYNNTIENDVVVFYDEMFSALYKGHDLTKAGFSREKLSKLKYEDFKLLFTALCFVVLYNKKVSFSSESDAIILIQKATKLASIELESRENFFKDLLTCVPMLTKDGQEYKFIHKTIIEFFSAYFLSFSEIGSSLIKKIISSNLTNSYKKCFDFLYQINKSLYIKEIGNIFLEDYIKFTETEYLKYNNYFKTILFFSDDAVITLTKNIKEKNGIYEGYNSQHILHLNGKDNIYKLSVSFNRINKYDDTPILFFKSFMDNNDFNISYIFSNLLEADIKNIVDTLVLDQSYKITSDIIFTLTNNNILKGLCLVAMTNHLESNMEFSAIIPEKCKSILNHELNKIDILDDL